ncbi:hypothetical protein [Actinomadura kijaniata]|uniref:hypothetical protein n=1 Tax=Actinomadura kijaniata TaxID=46161 RepID=UPI0031D8365B
MAGLVCVRFAPTPAAAGLAAAAVSEAGAPPPPPPPPPPAPPPPPPPPPPRRRGAGRRPGLDPARDRRHGRPGPDGRRLRPDLSLP